MTDDSTLPSSDECRSESHSDEVRVLLAKALLAQSTALELQGGRDFRGSSSFLPKEPFYDATFTVDSDGQGRLEAGGYTNEQLIAAKETLVLVFQLSGDPEPYGGPRTETLHALAEYLAKNTIGGIGKSYALGKATCSARHSSSSGR